MKYNFNELGEKVVDLVRYLGYDENDVYGVEIEYGTVTVKSAVRNESGNKYIDPKANNIATRKDEFYWHYTEETK